MSKAGELEGTLNPKPQTMQDSRLGMLGLSPKKQLLYITYSEHIYRYTYIYIYTHNVTYFIFVVWVGRLYEPQVSKSLCGRI